MRDILHYADNVLLPQMTAQEAIAAFDRTEAEALAVVDTPERRQAIGLLSEAHALRRYSDASERQRRELLGEDLDRGKRCRLAAAQHLAPPPPPAPACRNR